MKITSYNGNQKWVSDFLNKMEAHINREGGITVETDTKTRHQEWMEQWQKGNHEWMFLIMNQEDRECLRQMKQDGRRSWTFNRERIILDVGDILYIDSYKRKTTVHTEEKAYRIKANLYEEERILSEAGFIRVHHGYLVQTDKIKHINRLGLVLVNGTNIPVSRRYRKNLESHLQCYSEKKQAKHAKMSLNMTKTALMIAVVTKI